MSYHEVHACTQWLTVSAHAQNQFLFPSAFSNFSGNEGDCVHVTSTHDWDYDAGLRELSFLGGFNA